MLAWHDRTRAVIAQRQRTNPAPLYVPNYDPFTDHEQGQFASHRPSYVPEFDPYG